MDTTLQFQLKIIDFYLPFHYLLTYRISEYSDLDPSHYTPNSSVYCPFHPNTDTKAAKLYADKDSEKLYCFAENRLYLPHSLLSPPKDVSDKRILSQFKSIVPYDPQHVFSSVWNHISGEERGYWQSECPDIFIQQTNQYHPLYDMYRKGQLSLFSLLDKINSN